MKLTIRGTQSGFGQEECTEVTTVADYFQKEKVHYLFYKEITEDGREIRNRLTIHKGQVELRKDGNGRSVLEFCPGQNKNCHYQSPAGMLELISDTRKLDFHHDAQGIRLTLDYSFYAQGTLLSDYHLVVMGQFLKG